VRPVEWVSLEVAVPSDQADAGVTCPPPGIYKIRKDDTVVLYARNAERPDCPVRWSGDVHAGGDSVPAVMDRSKRVAAAFGGTCAPGPFREARFDAPQWTGLQAFIGSGGMYGWIGISRSEEHAGAGLVTLVSAGEPFYSVFKRPNLNFEHIVNGAAQDAWRAQDTPRTDPVELCVLSPACAELRWPATTSSWKLDCVMRYSFAGGNAVDMEFEVTPRKVEAPRGYLLFMWASYLSTVRERTIHFPGERGGTAGWVSFGKSGESGTVAGKGQAALDGDMNADRIDLRNIRAVEGVQFAEPVYYGLVDGDQNMETTEDVMAFIMMFDDASSTRFAVWNWGDNPYTSAWDWQYVLQEPEAGRTYRHRARLVLKRFAGEEDVLAEYRTWRKTLDEKTDAVAPPLEPFPVVLSPGEEKQDPLALGDAVCARDPARAVFLYRQALGIPVLHFLAAGRIDAVFNGAGDSAGLQAFWRSRADETPGDAVAWEHLGRAHAGAGDRGGARKAWERALQIEPGNRELRESLGRLDSEVKDNP